MKIYFGTVIRGAPIEAGGELVCLDWQNKTVDARTIIAAREPRINFDPNVRGNTRGCKGVRVIGDRVFAACYHGIHIFDLHLNEIHTISNGLMVDLHETHAAGEDRMWITSTGLDGALKIDLHDGAIKEALWPRELPAISQRLNLTPLEFDKNADNRREFIDCRQVRHPSHLHLNAICEWRGDVYGLFNKQAAIANLSRGEVIVEEPRLRGAHNLIIRGDGIAFVNDTRNAAVLVYDLLQRKLIKAIETKKFGWVRRLQIYGYIQGLFSRSLKLGKPLFLRGMDIDENLLYVGLSPAAILCIDWEKGELVDAHRYTNQITHCVHGLQIAR